MCLCLSLKTHAQTSVWNSGVFGSDVAESSAAASDGGPQCAGWKAVPPATSIGLQPAITPWSSSDYNQQDRSAQTLAYSATPTLTADVYMQTLCPSYTMLTYTHTPLLTNFGVSRRQLCVWAKVCLKFYLARLAFLTLHLRPVSQVDLGPCASLHTNSTLADPNLLLTKMFVETTPAAESTYLRITVCSLCFRHQTMTKYTYF